MNFDSAQINPFSQQRGTCTHRSVRLAAHLMRDGKRARQRALVTTTTRTAFHARPRRRPLIRPSSSFGCF